MATVNGVNSTPHQSGIPAKEKQTFADYLSNIIKRVAQGAIFGSVIGAVDGLVAGGVFALPAALIGGIAGAVLGILYGAIEPVINTAAKVAKQGLASLANGVFNRSQANANAYPALYG